MMDLVFMPIVWLEPGAIKYWMRWTDDEFAKRKIKWEEQGLKGVIFKGSGKNNRVNIVELIKWYAIDGADRSRQNG